MRSVNFSIDCPGNFVALAAKDYFLGNGSVQEWRRGKPPRAQLRGIRLVPAAIAGLQGQTVSTLEIKRHYAAARGVLSWGKQDVR